MRFHGSGKSPETSMSAHGDPRRDGVRCMGCRYAAAAGGSGEARTEGGSTSETRVTWCYGAPVPFHVFHCSQEVFPSVSLNFSCCIFFPFPFVLA